MWLAMVVAGRGLRPAEPPQERQLLERMAGGDGEALRELYDRHARAVYSLAVRILRSQQDAEDVVQEVFTQAWMHAARYDPSRGTVAGWLLMQARSRSIDRLRSRKLRPEGAASTFDARDPGEGPDAQAMMGEYARRVRAALGTLSGPQRTALELAFFEGLTYSQVAEHLHEPIGTVKTRIRQGLLRLKTALESARAGRDVS
jgi:RNA polymerase sigma-70 factor (ECF subfamily)